MAHMDRNNNSESARWKALPAACCWLALLVAAGIYLRLLGANGYHLSPDESMHVGIASGKSLSEVIAFAHYETHPPLLYILTHYWMMISSDPAFLRGISLLFGVAVIFVHYRTGRFLGGPMAGFCCAALVAFSFGCIIQSYVVRHYMILLLFLSLSYYYYIRWRRDARGVDLLAYSICGALACLTHFSGIFAIACFLLDDGLGFLRGRTKLNIRWLGINAIIIAIALAMYVSWAPILKAVKGYYSFAGLMKLLYALSYPLAVTTYVFPAGLSALAIVALLMATAFTSKSGDTPLRRCMGLAWIALGLGIALILLSIFPFAGTRHSLWTLPFLIPPVGWLLALFCGWLGKRTAKPELFNAAVAAAIIAGGLVMYDPAARFHDNVEYAIPQKQWQTAEAFFATLGPEDLIIAQKVDAAVLANVYPHLGSAPFDKSSMVAIVPYGKTRILLNPYYQLMNQRGTLTPTIEEARKHGVFDGVTRLVFINGTNTNIPIVNLMRCGALDDKQFIPPDADMKHLSADLILMTAPAQVFLDEVMNESGKAHGCIALPKAAP